MSSAARMYPHRLKIGLRPLLPSIALICFIVAGLSSVARAQLEVSESEVSEGDFNVIPGDRANYKFVIKATRTGTTKAEAEVKPYWYIIYATGIDIYGNPFYEQLAQGRTSTLYGQVTGTGSGGGTEAETQTFEGSWGTSDPTLLNYYPLRPRPTRYSAHQIAIRLYGDGDTAADPPADDAAFIAPDLRTQKGSIYFYNPETPDLAIPLGGVTYNAGTYDGGDIIRMTTTWRNNGGIILTPGETYKVHNYLTENAAIDWRPPTDPLNPDDAVKTPSDDYLLSEYVISGDRPVKSELDPTPIIPDAGSIVRKVEAGPLPSLTTYGILNRSVTSGVSYYGSTLRVYQPQPDDGYLDVGEVVSVTVEVKIPENYPGTYFVAGRVDPENAVPEPDSLYLIGTNPKLFLEIQDPALRRADNNSFVSNASAKITINGPTPSPSVEAVSAIADQDGQYIQGGGATSSESSPTADGSIIAFASAARNLLVPPPLAAEFIASSGRAADMAADPTFQNEVYGSIGTYLTTKQQIFYRLRDTRENCLASGLNGIQANADCFNPSISSATGRYIAFDSRASNLGQANTGSRSLIYITDVQYQTVKAIRPDANGDCFNPSISANGRFVAFESVATNLDPAKPIVAVNKSQQIYLHDRDIDGDGTFDEPSKTATYLVSVNNDGRVAYGGNSLSPVVSPWEPSRTGVNLVYVAYVSYAGNLTSGADVVGSNNEQVYRVKVNVGAGGGAATVDRVSINNSGDTANKPKGAPNGSIEPSISGDGSQVAFSSSADNLVYNAATGAYDGDTNLVPDVFVRDFVANSTSRISESAERAATGTITFSGPSLLLVDNLSLVNIPQNNPQPGDTVTITSGSVSETFVFGTDVAIGADVPVTFPDPVGVLIGQDACATRDNLVNAINASGLGVVASATTPTALPLSLAAPVSMGVAPSIYLRCVETGQRYNGIITFTGVLPVITDTDLTGGGSQAEDAPLIEPTNPDADPAVQRVFAGSNQPSISEDGRIVAFRSIAYNLDVQTLTPENNIDGGPPYTDIYPPSPRTGELIRPVRFPASNIYVRNRAVDSSLGVFDANGNVSTIKISLNNFGYPAFLSAQQATGVGSWTAAACQAPAVGGNGRVITFSSGAEGYGGLVFGENNLDPLDFQSARDVYIYDSQAVGDTPPPTSSRPVVALLSPEDGVRLPSGSTIALGASAVPQLGKTIKSVQFYVNGSAIGEPLTSEPYSVNYKLVNPGQYVVRVIATDNRGIVGTDSATISAGPPTSGAAPFVSLTQPPSQAVNYVALSQLVLNAFADDPDGTVVKVTFFFGGIKVDGFQGFDGNWYAQYRPDLPGSYTVFAMATDDAGNASVTDVSSVTIYGKGTSFPSVQIIPNNSGLPAVAGGTYPLRAKIVGTTPGLDINETGGGVLFYADDVYLGLGNIQEDGTYLLNWSVPSTPRTYAKIYAYLSSPNRRISFDPPEYANAIVRSQNYLTLNTADAGPLNVFLTKPANNATNAPGLPVLLEASASASVGQGTISRVEFYQNGELIGTEGDNAFPYQVQFTPPSPGQYVLTALAYSTAGLAQQSEPVTNNVVSGTPPTVAINTPKTGLVTPRTTLNIGWTASDIDGYVSKVQLLVNGVVQNEVEGGSAIVSYSPPSQGRYVFVARATDDLGNVKDSEGVTVTVDNTKPPVVPTVNLLPSTFVDAKYVAGSQLYFNATATARGGATLLSNSVRFYLFGADTYESSSATKILLGVDPIYASGVYTVNAPIDKVTAEASDSTGTIGISTVYPLEANTPPQFPLPTVDIFTNLPPSSISVAGGTITLRARASFPGATTTSASESRVEFYADGALIGTATAVSNGANTPSAFTHFLDWIAPTNSNSYKITARAIGLNYQVATSTNSGNSGGGSSGSANFAKYYGSTVSAGILTVNTFTNAAPSVTITSPSTNGAQLAVGTKNPIVASVTTATNTAVKEVQWFIDGAPAVTVTNFPYSFSFEPTSTGLYNIAAVAVDKLGLQGSSAVRTVSVVSGTPPSVAIIAPVATDQFFSGEKFTIAAAASGNGASITGVEFFVNGLSIGADTDSLSPFTIDYTPPAPGTYSIYARATDSRGNVKDSASVNIVVQGINPDGPVIQGKVLEVYQKLLSRVPTAAENQYWIGALSGGTTESTMITQLMGTAEYNDYQNKLLGYYYKLNVAPVNSTYLQQLGYMAIDRGALPPPANYPPQGPSSLAPSYGAVNGDARVAKAIVDSPAFNSANPGVQFYGDQQFMVWYFGQWPYGILGSAPDLVAAMGVSQFKQGYAAAFINALAYAARDTSAFDYQLKATSFLWLYYGVWQKTTTPAVSTAAQLKAYIQTLLGEPVIFSAPAPVSLSAPTATVTTPKRPIKRKPIRRGPPRGSSRRR